LFAKVDVNECYAYEYEHNRSQLLTASRI